MIFRSKKPKSAMEALAQSVKKRRRRGLQQKLVQIINHRDQTIRGKLARLGAEHSAQLGSPALIDLAAETAFMIGEEAAREAIRASLEFGAKDERLIKDYVGFSSQRLVERQCSGIPRAGGSEQLCGAIRAKGEHRFATLGNDVAVMKAEFDWDREENARPTRGQIIGWAVGIAGLLLALIRWLLPN